jgi:hypothetical protein
MEMNPLSKDVSELSKENPVEDNEGYDGYKKVGKPFKVPFSAHTKVNFEERLGVDTLYVSDPDKSSKKLCILTSFTILGIFLMPLLHKISVAICSRCRKSTRSPSALFEKR